MRPALWILISATALGALAASAQAQPRVGWSTGKYVAVGDDKHCVKFTATSSGVKRLQLGGCSWRFVCGRNGSRGAPSYPGRPTIKLNRAGHFRAKRGDRFKWEIEGALHGKRARGTFRFHYGAVCDTGVLPWEAKLKQKLEANPGGPYTITRGHRLRLDASRSKGKKLKYTWQLRPGGDCPEGADLATSKFTGERPTFKAALCGLRVTLTVRDRKGREDYDRTTVTVTPRQDNLWRVGLNFRTETHTYLPLFKPMIAGGALTRVVAGALRCPDGFDRRAFCRPVAYQGNRYKLAQVSDPDGPFDRRYYVQSPAPELTLNKVAFLNPYMEPDGPPPDPGELNWYRHNEEQGIAVAASRSHTIGHEGMGFGGAARSGHMRALVDAVRADDGRNDPRRYIETRVGPDRNRLESSADRCLDDLNDQITRYADDPLATTDNVLRKAFIWSPGFLFGEWVEGDVEHLPTSGTGPIPVVECAGGVAGATPGSPGERGR